MTLPSMWWRDKDTLAAELAEHGSTHEISRAHGVAQSTISVWANKHGLRTKTPGGQPNDSVKTRMQRNVEKPKVEVRGDAATIITDPHKPEDLGDLRGMMERRGLNPDEWEITHVGVNEWDAYAGRDDNEEPLIVTLRQLKCTLKRRISTDWLFPAVEVRERKPTKSTTLPAEQLVVILGDQQAPYQDEELHGAVLNWLVDVKPSQGALTGDTMDLPTISRHADRPHWNAQPQACIDQAYRLLSEYRDASPDMRWRKLRGNHDWRLESEMLNRAERMWGLAPADLRDGEEQLPLYSIRRFLHLDALGIELAGREGDKWELAEVELAPGVYVRHQPPNMKKLTRLHRSVVAGDTHRQSITQVTTWHGDEPHVITLVETGCMCRIDGLGFTEHPDWQQGFATVALGADGSVGFDLAVWRDDVLTWRGERWTA